MGTSHGRHPGRGEDIEDFSLDVEGEDMDEKDVRQYAQDHPDGLGSEDEHGQKRKDESGTSRPSKMLRFNPPGEDQRAGEGEQAGQGLQSGDMVDDTSAVSPSTKTRRTGPLPDLSVAVRPQDDCLALTMRATSPMWKLWTTRHGDMGERSG